MHNILPVQHLLLDADPALSRRPDADDVPHDLHVLPVAALERVGSVLLHTAQDLDHHR